MILMSMLMSALICSLSGSRLSEYIRAVLAVSDHLPTNSFFISPAATVTASLFSLSITLPAGLLRYLHFDVIQISYGKQLR